MNSKPVVALITLSALTMVTACEESVIPPPPPKPPQISTKATFTRGSGLPHNDVYDLLVTSEGELWIATQTGLAIYPSIDARTPSAIVNELNGLPSRNARRMEEHDGRIYVTTWGGGIAIYDMAADTWSSRGTANGLRAGKVADLAVSPTEGRVYFATANGVSIYNVATNNFTSFIPPNLLDPVVSAVAIRPVGPDIERWYGPRFEPFMTESEEAKHGITVSRGASTIIKITLANSALAEARVNDIYYDSQDNVFWVAFAVAGLAVVDPEAKTWTYHDTRNGLPSNTVYSVTRAGGTMWAGTQRGLGRLKSNGDWQSYDTGGGLPAERVRRVYSDDGVRLWLGFVDGGAARVDPASAQ